MYIHTFRLSGVNLPGLKILDFHFLGLSWRHKSTLDFAVFHTRNTFQPFKIEKKNTHTRRTVNFVSRESQCFPEENYDGILPQNTIATSFPVSSEVALLFWHE